MERQIFLRACNFCAYQERSQQEVRQRLSDWNCEEQMAEEIIAELITECFLNEERFAKTYAGSKFRVKKWGRLKIANALQIKGLTDPCIEKGLTEIDHEEYFLVLQALLYKKVHSLSNEENQHLRNKKAAEYAIHKGFEPELVWDILKKPIP